MKQSNFENKYDDYWTTINNYLDAKNIEDKNIIINDELEDVAQVYRNLCHHLSIARTRHYSPSLVVRLEKLVMRFHQEFYQRKTHYLQEIVYYFAAGFPGAIRKDINWVILSCLIFFGSLILIFILVHNNPDFALKIVDGEQLSNIESMYDPGLDKIGRDRSSDTDFQMFGFYIYNNTSIGLRTYASGLIFTIGAFMTLLFNGIYIGAIAGYLTSIGYGETFWPFVSGHSALELLAIAISGSAGMKLGYSIISPGRKTRLKSLRDQAQNTIYLMYGVIVMFVLAAFVEAYWSSITSLDASIKYSVGGVLWLLILIYFLYAGRSNET